MKRIGLTALLAATLALAARPAGANIIGFGGTNTVGMNYGTVFRMTTNGALTTLFVFGFTNGANPSGALVQGNDGNLYGTTVNGGTNNLGSVFQMTTNGILNWSFSLGQATGTHPYGALIQGQEGNLYGTAREGGAHGGGTVFRITPGGVLTNLYSFNSSTDSFSFWPYAGVVQGSDGNLYGTTQRGGTNNNGTVFRMSTNGSLIWTFSLNSTNGSEPDGGVVLASDGNLYGTTQFGGTNGGYGTVFRITTNGVLTSLASAVGSNTLAYLGGNPVSPLIQGTDGALYGTTQFGGTNNSGAVFKITTNGVLTVLASFNGGPATGHDPKTALVQEADGSFYGLALGGTNGAGTAFKMSPDGTLTPLHSFASTNDGYALNTYSIYDRNVLSLRKAADGTLYGTTPLGLVATNTTPGWVLNGGATISNGVLTLTDNNPSEARSAFYSIPQYFSNEMFASFIYQASGNLAADGVAFVMQSDPGQASALGAGGSGLGCGGLLNSFAFEFNVYNPEGVGVAFKTNGQTGGYVSTFPVNLASGHPIVVELEGINSDANGGNPVLRLTDASTGDTVVSVFDTAWSTNGVFVGFTSGSGTFTSTQTIRNFWLAPTKRFASGYNWDTINTNWALTPWDYLFGSFAHAAYADGDPAVIGYQIITNLATAVSPCSVIVEGAASIGGPGSINGTCALHIQGGASLSLACSNNYTGVTSVENHYPDQGLLHLSSANALRNSTLALFNSFFSFTRPLEFDQGIGVFTIGGLAGYDEIRLAEYDPIPDSETNPITLFVGNNNANTTFSGTIAGPGGLTKIGSGTLTLLGGPRLDTTNALATNAYYVLASNYAGPTLVQAGALVVAPTALGTGPVTIAPGATLALLPGFNQDVIAEAATNTLAGTTTGLDGSLVLYESGFPGAPAGSGLPSNGWITNSSTGVPFHLQPFTGNNALQLTPANGAGPSAGTLQLFEPGDYTNICVLGAAANGASTFYPTFNSGYYFSDIPYPVFFSLQDWFNGAPFAITNLGRASRTSSTPTFSGVPGNPRLYEVDLGPGEGSLRSVTFTDLGNTSRQGFARLNILAVTCTRSDGTFMTEAGSFTAGIGSLAGGGNLLLNGNTLAVGNTNNLSSLFSGTIADGNGRGNLIKTGAGALTLAGANTYTGTTTASNGMLIVNGSLSGSSVTVRTNATLGGNGSIAGSVQVNPGGIITAGADASSTGTLTMSNSVTLLGTTLVKLNPAAGKNDALSAPSITYGGTLTVSNISAAPLVVGSFQLFAATNLTGSFSSITLPAPGAGLRWDTNSLAVNGTLALVALPRPAITSFNLSGTNLVINAANGTSGSTLYVLASTNVALPLNQWPRLLTNTLGGSGSFTITVTNAVNPGTARQFFTLQVQ